MRKKDTISYKHKVHNNVFVYYVSKNEIRRNYNEYLDFCNKKTSRMGLCQQHYRRKSEGKTDWQLPLEKRIKSDDSCAVANCDRKVISRGLCRPHYRLKGRFNLSDNKIAELYLNPICSICGIPESPEFKMHAVDHNHSCCPARSGCEKCVRGLLCNNCNRAIGLFEDNPIRLQAAINYLSKYNLTNG